MNPPRDAARTEQAGVAERGVVIDGRPLRSGDHADHATAQRFVPEAARLCGFRGASHAAIQAQHRGRRFSARRSRATVVFLPPRSGPRGLKETGHEVGSQSRSEEHTSELQSLMRISYAVFCLNKKNTTTTT